MRTPANAATASSCMADSTSAAEAKTRGIRLELEIRLLGQLLGKQPPLDLVAAVGMVVVVLVVRAAAAAAPDPVAVVVRRLAMVVEGAGGV